MFDTSAPIPPVNLKAISFPSDRLTVGQLRRLFPDEFDHSEAAPASFFDFPFKNDDATTTKGFENFADMLYAERRVADAAYESMLGRTTGWLQKPLAVTVEDLDKVGDGGGRPLADYYVQFGLAGGEHEARELARDIVRAAFAQARQELGVRGV